MHRIAVVEDLGASGPVSEVLFAENVVVLGDLGERSVGAGLNDYEQAVAVLSNIVGFVGFALEPGEEVA